MRCKLTQHKKCWLYSLYLLTVLSGFLFTSACGTSSGPASTNPPTLEAEPTVTTEPTSTSTPKPTYDVQPASFYLGVDLSYVNEMDDCGAAYLENGVQQDAYELFSRYGSNLVRARLWHNPDWTEYSTLPDVEKTFRRAKEAGMATILDFHYSDDWADPGTQNIPDAWVDMDDDQLVQAVYDYTYEVLTTLDEKGLMPEFVQVGNETNSGMLLRVRGLDWARNARLFNSGIQAVRDVAEATGTNPKIILHVAQPENAGWWFREAQDSGITDFDVIGLSYYPQWSSFSLSDVGPQVAYLRETFQKEVIIVETAYPWTVDAVDETADNILNQGVRGYPFSPEGQRQFMVDLTQNLILNGGLGVVYWEPAWVSTQCITRWGQGSHWENATFFDFNNNDEVTAGIEFLSYDYRYPEQFVDGVIESDYGDPLLSDEAGDNLDAVEHLDLLDLYAREDTTSIYLALTISGDVYATPWGRYLFYFDTTQDDTGADIDVGRRPITVAAPYFPEFRLDIYATERKGTVTGSYEFYVWDGTEWQEKTLVGGRVITSGTPTVIEIQILKSTLGDPYLLNTGVVSTGRGRVHTAGDILGTSLSPASWDEPVILNVFTSCRQ